MRRIVSGGDVPLGGSPFPPIGDYGFLSDCEVTALVAPSGNVEWMCLPRMDGPSAFGALLDRDAGHFRVAPIELTVPVGRRYVPGTMILETTWQTRTGWLVVRDALVIGPWHHEDHRSSTHRRTPNDYDADHVLLRTMRCVNGSVEVTIDCDPKLDYGRHRVAWDYATDGYHVLAGSAPEVAGLELKLTTDLRLGIEGGHAFARTTMRDGDTSFVALSWSEHAAPQTFAEAYERLSGTADFWHDWMGRGEFPDHPWRTYLQRSALTLKGLTYAPTGALTAATTTSLPETPGGERNWDYRYAWIRDSTFSLWALYSLGFDWEATDFFAFIQDVAECEDELQIMYGIGGERDLAESTLDHLDGYEGAKPVRIGNGAYNQRQHDVWGVYLDSVYVHTKSRDQLQESLWPIICRQVECAITHWREPDRGIWEVRGEPQHFVTSKVFCWVACDRGARLARLREDTATADRWHAVAEVIKADVLEHGVDARGVFRQHYGTDALDASCLLLPLLRFLPADDERIVATVNAISTELSVDGLLLRYKVQETDDGLSGEEGAFVICSFWLVSALAEIGETQRARALCEKLLGYASPLLLYAEEIDPVSGRHLGNFPQAFTHLALINAVLHVIRADTELRREHQVLDARRREEP